jgi:glutathione S-transferase
VPLEAIRRMPHTRARCPAPHRPPTPSRWYLAELKVPDVELITVDMRAGQHKTPEYLKLHPFGQVPVLDDGGVT